MTASESARERDRPVGDYGPQFPSFWVAIFTAICVWAAMILRVAAPGRAIWIRRALLGAGVIALILTVALYFAVEHHPLRH